MRSSPVLVWAVALSMFLSVVSFVSFAVSAQPGAALVPPSNAHGEDTDMDGLYDNLVVEVTVEVYEAAAYLVSVFLNDSEGVPIHSVGTSCPQSTGIHVVSIRLEGIKIWANGVDGPYVVWVQLHSYPLTLIDEFIDLTDPYTYDQFEPLPAMFGLVNNASGVDIDGNGRFELFVTDFAVEVSEANDYRVVCRLMKLVDFYIWVDIAEVEEIMHLAVGAQALSISVRGSEINAAELDGPYHILLMLYDTPGGIPRDLDAVWHVTEYYSYGEFEAGSITSAGSSLAPAIDGSYGVGEWDDATLVDLGRPDMENLLGAAMLVKNSMTHLYICIDVLTDLTEDPGDYAAIAFDSDNDNNLTDGSEDQFVIGSMPDQSVHQVYSDSAMNWVVHCEPFDGTLPNHDGLAAAAGFGASAGLEEDHRVYEIAVPLDLIGVVPGSVVGFATNGVESYGIFDANLNNASSWPYFMDAQAPLTDYGDLTIGWPPIVSISWTAEGNQTGARFGFSVASAGDVNGDGYDDVVVGADGYDNGEAGEGCAFLYLGSSSGFLDMPSWTAEGNQSGANFGRSVASAGDVNGDGYDDVVIGADGYDNGETNEGRAFLYLGSSSGLSATPSWTAEGDQPSVWFGAPVASAGDVNGDGYDDVVVGGCFYDNGELEEGRAYLYLGSASGLSATPSWTAEGDKDYALFGCSVASAGDVNCDGYDDVVIGAAFYDNGEENVGRAYLYLGSSSGLSVSPLWTAEGNQSGAYFGTSVASAGDVNGDDYDDVLVGAHGFDNGETNEGRAYLYLGSPSGLSATPSWTAEGGQADANFGRSVASAGDVNGDGFCDVVIGVWYYDNGETDEGRAYLYLGSSSGLSATPSWAAEGDQAYAGFGNSVASAGDVNGDDFADIVVGAPFYDNGEETEGRAYLYLGCGEIEYHLVTFDQTGLSSDATGTVVTVDGEPKTYEQLPSSIWVEDGSTVSYSYGVTVSSTTVGRQYSLVDIAGLPSPITVTDQVTVIGNYDCPPTADAGPDQTVDEGALVTFDGSGSSNYVGIVNYTWVFTDGTEKTAYEVSPTYTFETAGTYFVTLNVSDTADNYATDTVIITVLDVNEPPVADAGANQTVTVGDVVTFNGSASTDDSSSIENYTWTFTYDGWARELYGISPTFTFGIPGAYDVALTVEDAEGETDADTATITVEEEEEEQEDEEGKSFIESYGLALGIVIALVIIALALFFVLKGRKGGMAPTSIDEVPASEPEVRSEGLRS